MPKSLKAKVGNKAKGRQNAKSNSTGRYVKQRAITERNRKRKRLKHLAFHPNDRQLLAKLKEAL